MQPIAAQRRGSRARRSVSQPGENDRQPAASAWRTREPATSRDGPILRDLNLRIDHDDRIALLGQNGNGKITFAKLIAGRLAPHGRSGPARSAVYVGLSSPSIRSTSLKPASTPYDHMARLMPDATEAQKRARLGAYGFGVDKADTKCAKLSGGEKARLLLALAAFHGPHLLILDEPTNHLDVDSREALVHALNDYEGAVILISHDRHLIEACADRLGSCATAR